MVKSGSESSISETCDSIKETINRAENEREGVGKTNEATTVKEALEVPKANMGKRGSLTSAKSLHELKHEAAIDPNKRDDKDDGNKSTATESKGIRPSKSDTSLTESFVVIDSEYSKRKHCPNVLREGISQLF